MKISRSLRSQLLILYLIAIAVPILTISFVIPYYYQYQIVHQTQELTDNTLNSLSNQIGTYLQDLGRLTIVPYLNDPIIQALKLITHGQYHTADPATQLKVNHALISTLPNYLGNTRDEIAGTIIVTLNGSLYAHSRYGSATVSDYPYQQKEWYRQAVAANGKVVFIATHPQDYLTNSGVPEVFSVARLIKDPDTQEPLAVMMADADHQILDRLIRQVRFHVQSIAVITDTRGNVLYANKPVSPGMLKQINQGSAFVEGTNDSFTVVSKTIQPSGWEIHVLLSNNALRSKVRWLYAAGFLFAVGGFVLTWSLFSILSRRIVHPFQDMLRAMRQVQRGNLEVRVQPSGDDEIAQLGKAFNHMISQLNELIDREYRAVLSRRNAEYRALQSQIQPHFLYNTLNGLIGLNRLGKQKELENAILSLSSLLRYSLDAGDWVTIDEEFSFLKKYCSLQQMRFQDRVDVVINCEEEVRHYLIPKLLLQPLIENTFIHGVEPCDDPSKIEVTAKRHRHAERSYLIIAIRDTGMGFDAGKDPGKTGIGLANVRERLEISYPGSSFQLESRIGGGTRVRIMIPEEEVRRNEDSHRG
ncbi:cache domain-containing sensor histidine kinase [Lihuaxuella thermophila]|uniref:Two-component system, sensor histidine kinase YesM n=1 Tax=Lihuaxuella thermophila TaxID=1173111 RepID=A0A1H8IZR6_9BACL|nr:sensor histidine kinase [Lihuaxuella thermophila]SEN73879.1 two-component system, sensor histidine kinase YesM [Lihuaxuella thermophila]